MLPEHSLPDLPLIGNPRSSVFSIPVFSIPVFSIPALFIFLFSFTLLLQTDSAHAQHRRPLPTKKLSDTGNQTLTGSTDIGFNSTLDNLITDSAPDKYDPATLSVLSGLRDIAQPPWDPFDYDQYDIRKATEKAFTIQGARHGSAVVKGSDLRYDFMYLKRGLDSIKDRFRYSLQQDNDSLSVTRNSRGRKLLELNLEFNASQGLDPQLKIIDRVRFRYDIIEKQHLLEYFTNF